MAVELTGPDKCAECGTELTEDIILAGDAGPLVLTITDVPVQIPGLYVCTPCAGSIMIGEREASVTPAHAGLYLTERFMPMAALYVYHHPDDEKARRRLEECGQVVDILFLTCLVELIEEAAEAEGADPEDMAVAFVLDDEPHPRDMAAMN